VITLGRLTRVAKHLGELIDRDFGTWSLRRVADSFDTETASSVFCSASWHRCARRGTLGISEGIKDILAPMQATHERIVGGPYDWQDTRDGIHRDANAEEQAILQAAPELKQQGMSLR